MSSDRAYHLCQARNGRLLKLSARHIREAAVKSSMAGCESNKLHHHPQRHMHFCKAALSDVVCPYIIKRLQKARRSTTEQNFNARPIKRRRYQKVPAQRNEAENASEILIRQAENEAKMASSCHHGAKVAWPHFFRSKLKPRIIYGEQTFLTGHQASRKRKAGHFEIKSRSSVIRKPLVYV